MLWCQHTKTLASVGIDLKDLAGSDRFILHVRPQSRRRKPP